MLAVKIPRREGGVLCLYVESLKVIAKNVCFRI